MDPSKLGSSDMDPLYVLEEDGGTLGLNEPGRQNLERQRSCHSDLAQAEKKEPLKALGFQQEGGGYLLRPRYPHARYQREKKFGSVHDNLFHQLHIPSTA